MDVDSSVHHVHTSHIWALGHKGSNMNPSRSHRNMNHPHHRDQCRLGTGPGYEAERFDALRSKVKRPLYGCDCLWDSTCESGFFLKKIQTESWCWTQRWCLMVFSGIWSIERRLLPIPFEWYATQTSIKRSNSCKVNRSGSWSLYLKGDWGLICYWYG